MARFALNLCRKDEIGNDQLLECRLTAQFEPENHAGIIINIRLILWIRSETKFPRHLVIYT